MPQQSLSRLAAPVIAPPYTRHILFFFLVSTSFNLNSFATFNIFLQPLFFPCTSPIIDRYMGARVMYFFL